MRAAIVFAFVLALQCSCDSTSKNVDDTSEVTPKKKKSAKKTPKEQPAPSPTGGATVYVDPSGKTSVKGGPKRTGDPKDCAAFDACCTAPEAGLFCGLAQSAEGDCAELLKDVKQYLSERAAKRPPGCN